MNAIISGEGGPACSFRVAEYRYTDLRLHLEDTTKGRFEGFLM